MHGLSIVIILFSLKSGFMKIRWMHTECQYHNFTDYGWCIIYFLVACTPLRTGIDILLFIIKMLNGSFRKKRKDFFFTIVF